MKFLKTTFNFALQHLSDFKKHDLIARHPIDVLGERLFNYYLWEMFPLKGQESLLEQFYQQTEKKREHWANLFKDIGHRLSSTGKHLDQSMKDRVKKFFNWRLKREEQTELRYFTFWLQAECLDAKWRLKAYSKVIDVCKGEIEDWEIYLKELCQMLPKHTAEVVECFVKLTDRIRNKNIYIQTEEAKTILKTGLNSTDTIVFENAERALNNLLRADKLEFIGSCDWRRQTSFGKMMPEKFLYDLILEEFGRREIQNTEIPNISLITSTPLLNSVNIKKKHSRDFSSVLKTTSPAKKNHCIFYLTWQQAAAKRLSWQA